MKSIEINPLNIFMKNFLKIKTIKNISSIADIATEIKDKNLMEDENPNTISDIKIDEIEAYWKDKLEVLKNNYDEEGSDTETYRRYFTRNKFYFRARSRLASCFVEICWENSCRF